MASDDGSDQPAVFDARKLEPAKRHRGSRSPSGPSSSSRRETHANGNDELPQPFDAKSLERAKKRARSRSPGEAPRKLKRPGQRARITDSEREAIRQRAIERERAAAEEVERQQRAQINDVVRSHYNAVPERGREWRKTDSTIKGLRSFNNWVKSCIIQKFSPEDNYEPGPRGEGELLVLDIGCGKGGDLGKWNQAPQTVRLYVGLDPADVSIAQARERYREMMQRGGGGGRGGRGGFNRRPQPRIFDARFHVKDCFGESIGDVNIVQEVGFDPNPLSPRGFDVVSMMFCMHYAFETEEKARTMLKNVSTALKKGGRFIGCIPNSDVIGQRVREFNEKAEEKKRKEAAAAADVDGEKAADDGAVDAEDGEVEEGEAEATAEWGNKIYRVRFPGPTPADGIFRPPFGWKYNFFLNEAVEEVPEYVVPWHAFRALAEDYNLELQFQKPFRDFWDSEKDDRTLGPLSERMGVRDRATGDLLVTPDEMEAAGFYLAFCFYKV